VVAALAIAAPRSAHAEEEGTEEVIVRGKASSSFVSRADVDNAPREVTDAASLVEWLPGVHVRRLGASDGFATMSIRGSSSNQVMVYLAGVPLTGGADPTLDLSSLPLWPGVKARAYRSFAPAMVGQGSLGGTLVLDPPALGTEPRSEVWAAAGSFGSVRMRVADARPEAGIVTALSASRSDDDFSYYDELLEAERNRVNAGHAAANALVSVVQPLGRSEGGVTMRSTTMLQARKQRLPGTAHNPTPQDRLESTRIVTSLELAAPVERWNFFVRGWGRRDDLHTRTAISESEDGIVAIGAAAGFRRRIDAVRVEARLDGIGERFAPGARIGALQPAGANRKTLGVGADVEWAVTKALSASASARLDTYVDEADGGASSVEALPTAHAGADLDLGPLSLVAHGGAVARQASFVERYGNRATFLGNPDLRPESGWAMDAGVRTARRLGPVRLRGELATFATWATDLITFVPRGIFGQLLATNIGRARLQGVEADLELKVQAAELRAVYTLLASANQEECTDATGPGSCDRPSLPGRPTHDLLTDFGYRVGPVRLRYGIDVVSGIHTDLKGDTEVPPRALHSTGVRLDVPRVRGLRVALDVRNLFDLRSVEYQGASGPFRRPIGDSYDFPIPGRSFLATIRWVHGL
jgi:vitamin B12 transporter